MKKFKFLFTALVELMMVVANAIRSLFTNQTRVPEAIGPTRRMRFCDTVNGVAFQFRMGAGFPGDVNRSHPASIEPMLVDATSPVTAYGNVGILDATTQGLRAIAAGDQSNTVLLTPYAALVRPYPYQPASASNFGAATLGAAVPPITGVIDGLRSGYIMAQLNSGAGAAVKGQPVFVWAAATVAGHLIGGYETAYSAGNTVQLDARFTYNGGADSTGVTEISFNA